MASSVGLRAAGYRASTAPVYPQAAVLVDETNGLFVVAAGGGCGAAQLMPAAILVPALEAACTSCGALDRDLPAERVTELLRELDAEIGRVVDDPNMIYKGSSAQAVVAVAGGDQLWLGNVGLGRAYRIEDGKIVQLTQDDSLLQEFIESGANEEQVAEFPHRGIVTACLNGTWRTRGAAWQPVASPARGALGFLLVTEQVHQDVPAVQLAEWSQAAAGATDLEHGARALWECCREQAGRWAAERWSGYSDPVAIALGEYDRKAALVLLRADR